MVTSVLSREPFSAPFSATTCNDKQTEFLYDMMEMTLSWLSLKIFKGTIKDRDFHKTLWELNVQNNCLLRVMRVPPGAPISNQCLDLAVNLKQKNVMSLLMLLLTWGVDGSLLKASKDNAECFSELLT